MNLIYLYDEFMRVPAGIEGNPVYIFDDTLTEGYELSDKIIENRYFLAKEAGAEIYRGNTYEILQEIHNQNTISKIITKSTFRPIYQNLFQKFGEKYAIVVFWSTITEQCAIIWKDLDKRCENLPWSWASRRWVPWRCWRGRFLPMSFLILPCLLLTANQYITSS